MNARSVLSVVGALALGFAAGWAARPQSAPAPTVAPTPAHETPEWLDAPDAAVAEDAWVDVDAGPRWYDHQIHDEMRGTDTLVRCIDATSDLNLLPPYAGGAGRFCLRRQPDGTQEAFFAVTTGQITCAYDGCRVAVRFDDDPVRDFRAASASQGYTVLFINDAAGFARRALTAHRFVMEVEFYSTGRRQVAFDDVDGLVWELPPVHR